MLKFLPESLLLGKKQPAPEPTHLLCDMFIDLSKLDVVCIERTDENETIVGYFYKDIPNQTSIQEWFLSISDETHNRLVADMRRLTNKNG